MARLKLVHLFVEGYVMFNQVS